MKITNFSIASFALFQLASTQPLKPRHAHAALHQKKQVEQVNQVEVLVYVNQEGSPVSTTTETLGPSSTSIALSTPTAFPSFASTIPTPPEAPQSATPETSQVQTPETPSSSSSDSSSSFGLSYSPYNADGTCKTQSQVTADFAVFGPAHPNALLRTYGTDCNQLPLILAASKPYNMRLFAGIYDINSIPSEVSLMKSAANGDWSRFDTVSVGNELVNSGAADAQTVVNAIGTARGLLRTAGYNGPVVTVDTLVATRNNPILGQQSDYVAVNCHPFFDSNTEASSAGSFITSQMKTLKSAIGDDSKKILITETGWPTKGESNGQAIPSQENQNTAIAAIKGEFADNPQGVVLFTPFNDMWKTNTQGQFMAEQWWGMWGNSPSDGS